MMRVFQIGGLAGVLVLGAAAALAAPPALYSAAQAAAGAGVYAQSCAMCHGADLSGGAGPALTGPGFGDGMTVGQSFTFITQQMPAGAAGSLSHTQYEDVMAYLLSKNGFPAGAKPFDYQTGLASHVPVSAKP